MIMAVLLPACAPRIPMSTPAGYSPPTLGQPAQVSKAHASFYFDGIPQADADPEREPVKWRMLHHPRIPKGDMLPPGESAIQFFNGSDKVVLVIVVSGMRVGSFFLERSSGEEHSVPNGEYRVYVIYSEDPDSLHEGQNASLSYQRLKITVGRGMPPL